MRQAPPKISVCIVTYNHERYIADCLLSVLAQSYDGALEILVGNDCSTDSTAEEILKIEQRFPGRITNVVRERNMGSNRNCQDLVARATGDYVALVDGDDYWLPSKLAMQFNFLAGHPDCLAVYSNAAVVDDTGTLLGCFNNPQPSSFDMRYLLSTGNFLNLSSTLFRASQRQLFLGLGDNFIDYKFHLHLSRFGRLGYINKCLVVYRKGSTTSMIRNNIDNVKLCYWQALSDPHLGADEAVRVKAMGSFFTISVLDAIRLGQLSLASRWIKLIKADSGALALRVFLFGGGAIARHILLALGRKLCPLNGRKEVPVIYRR